MTKIEVAQITSRESVHKYIQELKSQNYAWDVIKVKLIRERFSDCTSIAAAQNKPPSLKQDGRSMHEYITHFSDLLEHAYSVKATDVGTNLFANQFIEGIDDTNKYMKNKLRENLALIWIIFSKKPWDSNTDKKLELLILGQTCAHKSQNVQT